MAFTVTARHAGNSGTSSAQTRATNSTTPTANSLFIVAWGQENDANATAPSYQTPSGGSLSYTLVGKAGDTTSYPWDGDDAFRVGTAVYRAPIGPSPSAFAVTVDSYSGTTTGFYGVVCFDITGHDTTTPIVASSVAATGATKGQGNTESGTVTLGSTPSVGNLVVVVFTAGADSGGGFATPTAGVGKSFTAVTNQSSSFCQTGVFYRVWDGSESTTVTCSDLGQSVGNYSAVVFEVAAAAGSGTDGTATPAAAAVSVSVPQATPSVADAGTPAAAAATVAVPQATSTGAAAVNPPSAVAVSVSIPQASPSIADMAAPAAASVAVSLPQAAASGAGNATVTPGVIAATVAVPASQTAVSVATGPATLTATASVPAATTQTAGNATVQPAAVSAAFVVPAASRSGAAAASPAAVAAAAALPSASPLAGGNVTVHPSLTAVAAGLPSVGPVAAAVVSPAVIAVVSSLARPGAAGSAGPASITLVGGLPAAGTSSTSTATVSPPTVAAMVAMGKVSAFAEGEGVRGRLGEISARMPGGVVTPETFESGGTIR